MTETNNETEGGLEGFKEKVTEGLNMVLEDRELMAQIGQPLHIDPFSLGIDDKATDELSQEEISTLREVTLKAFNTDEENLPRLKVKEYTTQGEDKKDVTVLVYKQTIGEDDFFLYELTYSDGQQTFMIADSEYDFQL